MKTKETKFKTVLRQELQGQSRIGMIRHPRMQRGCFKHPLELAYDKSCGSKTGCSVSFLSLAAVRV